MLSIIKILSEDFAEEHGIGDPKIIKQEKKEREREKAGGSNVGKYKKGPFCGPSGGSPDGSFPIDTKKRAHAALAYAHNAPNPQGIKDCVYKHYDFKYSEK